MAIITGRAAKIKVGASPSLVGKLIGNIQYEETDTAVDVTTGDSTTREFLPLGLKSGSGSFQAMFDTADAGQDAIRTAFGGTVGTAIELYPEGATTGKMKLSGTVVFTSLTKVDSDFEGAIKMSCSFTGVLTEGTSS